MIVFCALIVRKHSFGFLPYPEEIMNNRGADVQDGLCLQQSQFFFLRRGLRTILGISNAHHSCVGKRESCLGSVFPIIYKGSIQFSDTLMSDGYFRIF